MRLDIFLSQTHGISRSRAKSLIEEGSVTVLGKSITKASFDIDELAANDVSVDESSNPYVSRGGLKLRGALDAFGIDPKGRVCADIGASTGGFTDCLLKNGATRVYAVDSGSDQLAEVLKKDERVVSIEHFNARNLTEETFGEKCSLAVADLSFISQTLVLEGICAVMDDGADYVGLIKPQFECGKSAVGKGGIVKKATDHLFAIERVCSCAVEVGLDVKSVIVSPIKGGDGNREFLFHAVKAQIGSGTAPSKSELSALVRAK